MAPEAELPVVAVVVIGIGEKPATLAKSTSVTRGPMKPSDHHMRTNTELALTGQVYALHFYLTRWGVGWWLPIGKKELKEKKERKKKAKMEKNKK